MSKKFDEDVKTPAYISLIYRKHSVYLNRRMQEFDLTFGLYPFIIEIYKHEGLSQNELAELFFLNESTVARNLKKLNEKELINKTKNKRKNIITITEKGEKIAKQIMNYEKEWDEKIKKLIGAKEFNNYEKQLRKISEGLI